MTASLPPDGVPDLLGGRYRTDREIGHGGMARVVLAHDIKHGRDVAVKVIRAELAASMGRERFLREIAIAARLRHPNIVPLFDSGDADGVLYFVMPYEAGPSLRRQLDADGPLPMAEAISVLRDVARALQYAHGQGVVHRDIKPDNVLLSGGTAVVADFGIAKAVSAAQAETQGGSITQTGAGIGTPAYMAPEQAVGDPSSDHRADIYSYGCLAYEVLTGTPPFHDLSMHQVIAAHMTTVPRPVNEVRADVPASMAQLVARCLAKEPADRPQSAADVLAALSRTDAPVAEPVSTRPASRFRAIGLVAVLTIIVIVATTYHYFLGGPPLDPLAVGVLPFGNTSGDTSIVPYADGLGDEVFSALMRVSGLRMRSRSGARRYQGTLSVDAKEVGRKLNVDYLVTGVMREANDHWIITWELTRTSDDTELFTGTLNRAPRQTIGVAEEIATAAATALREKVSRVVAEAPRLAPNQKTTSPEAFRLFLVGQEQLRRRGQSMIGSAQAFRDAIRLDSSYAGAYAGLSLTLSLYPYFQGVSPSEVSRELVSAAQRALQLDSTLAQPHVALAMAAQQAYQWDRAENEFKTALRLPGSDAEALVQYGRHLLVRGMISDGARQMELARRADPASPLVLGWVSYARFLLGDIDSARVISAQARQGAGVPNFSAAALGGLVLVARGLRDSARAVAHEIGVVGDPDRLYVLAATGDTAAAFAALRVLDTTRVAQSTRNTAKAMIWLGVGDTAAALTLFEKATDAHEIWPVYLVIADPAFDPIRRSDRLLAVLRRVGLTPAAAATDSRSRAR